MQRDFVAANSRDMLSIAFMRLQECNCHTLPVVENGRLLGVVTADHLAEALMIGEALREASSQRRPRSAGVSRRQPASAGAAFPWRLAKAHPAEVAGPTG